jgi:ubiquinone/menaquinone biosynthesis C-methylase UbiE
LDFQTIKQRQQKIWSAGDFAKVGAGICFSAELLCEAMDIRAGERILDVATGTGNAAIAAARRGADVTGIDYVPAWLERAATRASAEVLPIQLDLGDAENLPYPDGAFDAVISSFGAMFAPDPDLTAKELARVCRSEGRLGMINWTPRGMLGAMFRVNSLFVPAPEGLPSPLLWGDEQILRRRLSPYFDQVRIERRNFIWRARSPQEWLQFMVVHYGPMKVAYESLPAAKAAQYAADMLDAVEQFNRATDGTLYAPAEYLEAVASRRSHSRLQ